jgi:hypothetical protein
MAVVQVGGRDGGEQQAPVGVHQRMALATDNPLGGVIAAAASHPDPAGSRGLRVHHGAGWRGSTPDPSAVGHGQRMCHALEDA